jgi:ribosome biogenesis GTPase / thiamine phosphate phosphatase
LLSDRIPVRVIADYGADYLVDEGASQWRAAARRCDPAVGDWVTLDGGFITEVLARRTAFSRRAAGDQTREQVLAANIDVAFVVAAAIDVNVRRIERYLTIAWQSGATPVVVITKLDLADTVDEARSPARASRRSAMSFDPIGPASCSDPQV